MKTDLDKILLGIFFFDSSSPFNPSDRTIGNSDVFIDMFIQKILMETFFDWDNNPICF